MQTCPKCEGRKYMLANIGCFRVEARCDGCYGTGVIGELASCPECKGSKKIVVSADKSPFGIACEAACGACNGMGKIDPRACKTCNGSKKSTRTLGTSRGHGMLIEVSCPDCSA